MPEQFGDNDDLVSVSATEYSESRLPFTNWSPHAVKVWGIDFPTAEHAYQYKKHLYDNPKLAEDIRAAPTPEAAKLLSWSKPINQKRWDKQRQAVMLEILMAKHAQHACIREALSATGDKAIVQEQDGDDMFWGIGKNGNGRNTMGKLWMIVREISHA